MTDLSTTNLRRLLAEATPGPWVRHPESPRVLSNLERKFAVHVELTRNGEEPQPEDVANTELIALAPPLAEEVLRLRKGLKAIYSDLHESALCNGGTTGPYLQGATAQAAATIKQIDQILGDHDE